jgi:class 3 adenylate cyclase/tetratricopeptide (TPR) repeat protein
MTCPHCQRVNPADARFCTDCGRPLEVCCPTCQMSNPADSRFCKACGRSLSTPATPQPDLRGATPQSYTPRHLAEKILTSRSALEGERKQVTVLFCDITNSTALAERLGPEVMHVLLQRFFELALSEIHRYEGTINQFLGDGFMALFGAPLAYEDHARRAVLAALGLQQGLQEHRATLGEPYGEEVAIRLGLNTGLVVVGGIGDNLRMDYTAVGDTTNLAARLQQRAEPGTILLSDATARLVWGEVRVEAMGPVQVKGKREPVAVYKLLGYKPLRSPLARLGERALSRFVGRERELAVLHQVLEHVERGQGQVVGVVGEAGVGKSRLLYEFRQSVRERRVTYLEGRCLAYGRAMPYLPVRDLLRVNCGITEADSTQAMAEKVRLSLQEVGIDPDEGTPYLLQLIGVESGTERLTILSPEAIKTRTFATLLQMHLGGSQRRSLIIEVEDLHWVDQPSEEYFTLLAEHLLGVPVLLLGTHRPGYRPPWIEKFYVTQIALRPLGSQDGVTVIRSIAQREQISNALAQVILAKAEGNPFFLEELTRAVMEQGELQAEVAVPGTIQGVLMARIDRLPDATKRLLQTASVLGRAFAASLLEALWEGPGELGPRLQELKQAEFLYERSEAGEPVYVFKHALSQEVAYESLLTTRRQTLHAAAGRALEVLYTNRLEELYGSLAYHYAKTAEPDKAIEYLTRFAEQAAHSYAHTEAVTALQEALVHVERLPIEARDRGRLELVLRQAHSLFLLGRLQEVLDLFLRHQALVERLQDSALAGSYYFWLGHTYSIMGDRERAAQNAQRALDEATRCRDEAIMGKTYYVLAVEALWSSQPQQGVEHGRHAVSLLERTEERYWLGIAHWVVGFHETILGNFESALEAQAQTHTIGEAIGDPRLQSYADWTCGWNYAMRGDWEVAIDVCKEGLEHKPDPYTTAIALGFLGYAYLEKGDTTEAIPLLEQSVEQFGQFRYRQIQSFITAYLSEAYLLHGHLEKARDLAIQGLELARGFTFWYGVGRSLHVLGRIARASGALAEAGSYLQEALQTFASIPCRFEAGRTHLDLAALAHALGNPEIAVTHYNEAHALFGALRVPKYVERTAQLAPELGVSFCEDSA